MTTKDILSIVETESGVSANEMAQVARFASTTVTNAKQVAVMLMLLEGYRVVSVAKAIGISVYKVLYANERGLHKLAYPVGFPGYDPKFKTLYLACNRRIEDAEEDGPEYWKPRFWIDDECIINIVSSVTGIPVTEIKGSSRDTLVLEARNIAISFIIKFNPARALKLIGAPFGKDYSTVIHSKKRVALKLEQNRQFKELYWTVTQQFINMERQTA